MRAVSVVLLVCLFAVVALAQESVPAPTATPEPTPAPTTPAVTVTNPPTPVKTGAKGTPGRHCRLRSGCGDCLAINYCVWSPSKNVCLDKHKATLADDVVHTCDPDVCAKHGGRKPRDTRSADHVAARIVNARGRRVIADAVAVNTLPKSKNYRPYPRARSQRTYSDDAHVVIKKGSRKFIFTSDNNGPIIRGEAEARQAQYLAEKREHARQVYRRNLCRAARGCGAVKLPKKKQFRSPEYYPVRNTTRNHELLKADSIAHDADLRRRLLALRDRADVSLNSRSGVIAAKRQRLHDLLDQVTAAVNRVNTEAAAIDSDATVYARLSKQVADLEEKVTWTCAAPNSAFIELAVSSEGESDSTTATEAASASEQEFSAEGEASAELEAEQQEADSAAQAADSESYSESEVAAEAEAQVEAEQEAEQEDFASAEQNADSEQETESEAEDLTPEQNDAAVASLTTTAAYPDVM